MSGRRGAPTARDLVQQQLKQKSATRLVNSPHAKYNSRDQLMCVVCGCRVTSAIVWQTHIAKKSHIENLANLNRRQYLLNNPLASKKRKATSATADSPPAKKIPTVSTFKPKGILKGIKSYSSSSDDEESVPHLQPTQTNGHSLSSDNNVATTDQVVKTEIKEEPMETENADNPESAKSEDENDPSVFYLTENDKKKPAAPPKPNTTEKLPEGFFDDPVADAKARKVEYVNKDEAEYNAFMREVSAAATTSRQIIADDTEESANRNQIIQVEEQIQLCQRVLQFDLAIQSPPVNDNKSSTAAENSSDDDSDLDNTNDPLHWRDMRSSFN